MTRHSKIVPALLAAAVLVEAGYAFTIWGPTETFQTTALSYLTRYFYSPSVNTLMNR